MPHITVTASDIVEIQKNFHKNSEACNIDDLYKWPAELHPQNIPLEELQIGYTAAVPAVHFSQNFSKLFCIKTNKYHIFQFKFLL